MIETFRDLLPSLIGLWPLWLFVGAVALARFTAWLWRERELARSGIREIDEMDGRTFERRLVVLFRGLGYAVEHVGRRGDYGADLVVAGNGERMVIQAKRWSRNVGVKAVQEANAAPAMHECSRAMVVTNRYFTQAARRLAKANGVELWDRDRLVKALLQTGS